jgi:hypothetical protein
MKKQSMRFLIKILIILILFSIISILTNADIEAKYTRNFVISKNTILKIPSRTSGCMYFKLGNGEYRIKIKTLRYSNMLLNDSIESNLKDIYYPDMSPGQYIYDLQIKRSGLYEQCFLTTTMSAKLSVEIIKK